MFAVLNVKLGAEPFPSVHGKTRQKAGDAIVSPKVTLATRI